MATLKERESLIKSLKVNDGTHIAGRREEALKLYDQWKINNFGTTDVRVTPPREALPPWAWPYIPKADAPTTRDGMKIANFLTPSGTGKTLSDEWYDRGLETILESTEPGGVRDERLDILMHQFLDQVSNPQNDLKIAKSPAETAKSDVVNLIKKLTREGKHNEAQALYKEQFGRV